MKEKKKKILRGIFDGSVILMMLCAIALFVVFIPALSPALSGCENVLKVLIPAMVVLCFLCLIVISVIGIIFNINNETMFLKKYVIKTKRQLVAAIVLILAVWLAVGVFVCLSEGGINKDSLIYVLPTLPVLAVSIPKFVKEYRENKED